LHIKFKNHIYLRPVLRRQLENSSATLTTPQI